LGKLVEHGPTEDIFSNPSQQATKEFIDGKVG
ncbi:MAG: hypothetical protein K0Q74_1122, partial [Gammaproteobacteria bacterium]|nr:hypothetical protein [Gammaproteobacteria bacterium]